MSRENSPCYECPNKGCGAYHGECEKYLAFVKANEEYLKKKREGKEIDEYKRYEYSARFRRENRKGRFKSSAYR